MALMLDYRCILITTPIIRLNIALHLHLLVSGTANNGSENIWIVMVGPLVNMDGCNRQQVCRAPSCPFGHFAKHIHDYKREHEHKPRTIQQGSHETSRYSIARSHRSGLTF